MGALVTLNDKQMALIRRTVAKDCDQSEFDWAIEICKATRLDPLRRQIYFFVFNKDDPKKRQMVPVVGIGGYRAIAERTGNYRPGKTETHGDDTLRDPLCNPLGITHATATVYKYIHGGWFAVEATAHWDEFAPIVETGEGGSEWVDSGYKYPEGHAKAGKPKMKKVSIGETVRKLDPAKDGWRKMPRIMIEKCAEALALRKAWPDDFSGLYAEGETDRAESLDLTPSELADASEKNDRIAKLGGPNAIMVQWHPNEPLERVPTGAFGDRALAFIRDHLKPGEEEAGAVLEWSERNRHSIREYWGQDKDGFVVLKAAIDSAKMLIEQPLAAE